MDTSDITLRLRCGAPTSNFKNETVKELTELIVHYKLINKKAQEEVLYLREAMGYWKDKYLSLTRE